MCKYEMDPMSIVEDTERTRFCPQTDRRTDGRTDSRTDGQTDKVIPVYPPINFVEAGGIIKIVLRYIPYGSMYNRSALVLGKGRVLNRGQAITWTNDGPV